MPTLMYSYDYQNIPSVAAGHGCQGHPRQVGKVKGENHGPAGKIKQGENVRQLDICRSQIILGPIYIEDF